MKTEQVKELNSISSDIIEEAVDSKTKVGKNSLLVKMLMKKFIRNNKLNENQVTEAWYLLENFFLLSFYSLLLLQLYHQ